ncbi:hypothetical protein NM688_g1246 [Phlebia brevispora]|uniref:Uncharacterized protein n=1 Tax=Phlebia brevispora TaxID=194682 RepID=A0ACC1TCR4_9APHY|nr:hypothetical protein NM688_g1246 [Phlebia brevispora]
MFTPQQKDAYRSLSDLFLDTEHTQDDLDRLANRLSSTGISTDALESMLRDDLFPVLYSNLISIAGSHREWSEALQTGLRGSPLGGLSGSLGLTLSADCEAGYEEIKMTCLKTIFKSREHDTSFQVSGCYLYYEDEEESAQDKTGILFPWAHSLHSQVGTHCGRECLLPGVFGSSWTLNGSLVVSVTRPFGPPLIRIDVGMLKSEVMFGLNMHQQGM